MKNIESAIKLYKKFIDGVRWLNARKLKGEDVSGHEEDFERKVVKPLDELWRELGEDERTALDKITEVVWGFTGKIIIEDVRGIFLNTLENVSDGIECADQALCPNCGEPGERYTLGYVGSGDAKKTKWGLFCAECEPEPVIGV